MCEQTDEDVSDGLCLREASEMCLVAGRRTARWLDNSPTRHWNQPIIYQKNLELAGTVVLTVPT